MCLQGPGGSTVATLVVSKRVPDGSVVLAHGWGGEVSEGMSEPRRASEANANALTSDTDIDPYCGMPVLQNHLVRIAEAAG